MHMKVLDYMIMNGGLGIDLYAIDVLLAGLSFAYNIYSGSTEVRCQKSAVPGFLVENVENRHLPCTFSLPTANRTM